MKDNEGRMTRMSGSIEQLMDDLKQAASLSGTQRAARAQRLAWLAIASDQQIDRLFDALTSAAPLSEPEQNEVLSVTFDHLIERRRRLTHAAAVAAAERGQLERLATLYRRLGPHASARNQLLRWLGAGRLPEELHLLAELLASDPPQDPAAAALALAPLLQHSDYDAAPLFPRLLDALAYPTMAAAVLDLGNFVSRKGLLPVHPAGQRRQQLTELLGGVVQRLAKLEEASMEVSSSPQEVSGMVNDAVALAVTLCDALALIGDPQAIGKLNQALQLKHRRIRTEAAAALARLGDEAGREALLAMAEEPVARLRVLAYADELGLSEQVQQQFATDEARAEAEVALWLAQPTQFGLPPTQSEVIDRCRQFWPSYEQPVACYLVRYTYQLGQFHYSNIAIAGPLTHTFTADLSDLPPQLIYAAFAGWHAEHPEITQHAVAELAEEVRQEEVVPLEERLAHAGYQLIESQILGEFFGQIALVARVSRGETAGVVVVDQEQILWLGRANTQHPLGPEEAYCIYKGRKLLQAFNE